MYSEETMIRIADGTTKCASEIKVGDMLLTFSGKNMTVGEVLVGQDTQIYNIIVSDGNNIRVSGGHAIKLFDPADINGKKNLHEMSTQEIC